MKTNFNGVEDDDAVRLSQQLLLFLANDVFIFGKAFNRANGEVKHK